MEDLKDFISDEERMENAWDNVVSKNLPKESECSQDDFNSSLLDAVQAVDWVKVNWDVMVSLYDYGHDED